MAETPPSQPPEPATAARGTLGEVAALFLRLGITAFGGPAAHIAMMRDEVVRRRKWITDQHFLDLLGATNLIPGPNSTEMAIHLGHVRAGWTGLIVGGALFILPAMLIVLALAWVYVAYGNLPQAQWLLYGIKPVIIAVVAQALWGLLRTAVKGPFLAAVGLAVLALYLLGFNEIALLFGGGILGALVSAGRRFWANRQARSAAGPGAGTSVAALLPPAVIAPPGATPLFPALQAAQAAGLATFSLGTLFLTFLKIGAVLYGSGYVLLAFLRNDFVGRLGWLTEQQLLDAVAIGQFTPGPVFTTATFIGYVVGGLPGALLATAGIFLPSFIFVAAINPLVPRLRASPWTGPLLDGVNVAALGLMAAVTWELGWAAVVDWLTAVLAVAAAVLLIRFKVNSTWLVLGGGVAGIAYRLLAG
ncbi:MAG: chromate efflux transporter [Chloroflexi bacterium]|nr:chromate efflux transporter [Chloroflexota bacterium]